MAILCGTDLSKRGTEAAEVSAAFAAKTGEPLYLAHALEFGLAERAQADIDEAARNLEGLFPELHVETRVEYGLPDEVLTRLAHDGEMDRATPGVRLVVVGSLGRRLPRWILGSVAERTVQTSTVPVLVVRDSRALLDWLGARRPLRVMVGFDFGEEAEAALVWTSALTRMSSCEVIVVHVAHPAPAEGSRGRHAAPPCSTDELEVRLMADLRSRLAAHEWGTMPPRAWVVLADSGRTSVMASLAADERVELLVIGSRHRAGSALPWHQSVSRGVLYSAATNVVCVPVPSGREAHAPAGTVDQMDDDRVGELEVHAFLRGVPGDLLRRLSSIAHPKTAAAGDLLFREGDDADRLFLIRHGAVALEVAVPGKPPIRLETLGVDDILGLSWLKPPYRYQFDARATAPVETMELDAARLREWMREDPRMGQAVATRLVSHLQRRLERVRLQRLDVSGAEA